MFTVICRLETAMDYFILIVESLDKEAIDIAIRNLVGWETGAIDIVVAFEGKQVPIIYEGYGRVC